MRLMCDGLNSSTAGRSRETVTAQGSAPRDHNRHCNSVTQELLIKRSSLGGLWSNKRSPGTMPYRFFPAFRRESKDAALLGRGMISVLSPHKSPKAPPTHTHVVCKLYLYVVSMIVSRVRFLFTTPNRASALGPLTHRSTARCGGKTTRAVAAQP